MGATIIPATVIFFPVAPEVGRSSTFLARIVTRIVVNGHILSRRTVIPKMHAIFYIISAVAPKILVPSIVAARSFFKERTLIRIRSIIRAYQMKEKQYCWI